MATPLTGAHSGALVELRCWIPRPVKDALSAQAQVERNSIAAVVRHVLYLWAREQAA